MYLLLDGRLCQGVVPGGAHINAEGYPETLIYFYDSPEGNEGLDKITRKTPSIAWVRMDSDGSTWTAATAPRGAHFAVEVYEHVDLGAVYTHLTKLHGQRDALLAAGQGGATHGPGAADVAPGDVFAKPDEQTITTDDRPMWKQLGYASKNDWKNAGSPTS